jgi:bacterioferritin
MKGNPKIMPALDELLAAELCAINTYFVNAKLVGNWGFLAIERKLYDESMTEMRHAETLIDRIIYLDGIPNLNKLGRVKPGKNVPEQFTIALELEVAQCARLAKTVELCRAEGDEGTRLVLEPMVTAGDETIDWLETQFALIKKIGENDYLAQQLSSDAA